MTLVRDKESNGVIQAFAPTDRVEVSNGQTITFKHGSVFMNEAEGSFNFNGLGGFYFQPNVIMAAAKGDISLAPQGAGARFLVTGGYSVA